MAKKAKDKGQSSAKGGVLIGDFSITFLKFDKLAQHIKEFKAPQFQKLNFRQRNERINQLLLDLIQKVPAPCFLLPAVVEFIDRINAEKILDAYVFSHFELWLNQFSGLSAEENYQVRAKVVGKWVPRDAYQIFFPIGMGKSYPGSHYVTAHSSPDLDTTVSSFWGWVDAFAARVGQGLHLWNVPGGPPESQVEIDFLFYQMFGQGVFHTMAKTRTTLALSSIDLMTQKGILRKQTTETMQTIDRERQQNAVVLVDEEGYYLGDWRNFDVEGVRQVINLLNMCLRWYQSHLHVKFISFFSQEDLSVKNLPALLNEIFQIKISDCEPAIDFTQRQRTYVDHYLIKVLGIRKGMETTIEEFAKAMRMLSLFDFQEFIELLESLHRTTLFDRSGRLVENRPRLFHMLEKIIKGLEKAILSVRDYVERLDVALKIKKEVFGYTPHSVSFRAEVDEIRSKIGDYFYVTVTSSDVNGKLFPLGIISSSDLHKSILGTVSLRDFCNREETKIPSYFEVISVIDHHRSQLQTTSAPLAMIADSQSSNVLCAEMAFEINDRYGLGGMSPQSIKGELKQKEQSLTSASSKRLLQRLLQRCMNGDREDPFFIDPQREYLEYLHFLYGILDDTDLLTKVSARDVECVASLLNRLKSLMLQKEAEIVAFDDLPRDDQFVEAASKRILQNDDMYSLYRKIYLAKEQAVEENIHRCIKGQPSFIFTDTKEQNGCARVGQTKMFRRNYAAFAKSSVLMRKKWVENAADFWRERSEMDLHMHMISTIAGAEDLYKGTAGKYGHPDELWIWIPFSEQSIEHLKSFLNAFRALPQFVGNDLYVELYGEKAKEYARIFSESFLEIPSKVIVERGAPSLAVLKYNAGSINSRKAMISPHLPKQVK